MAKKSTFNTALRVMADINRQQKIHERAQLRAQTTAAREAERAKRAHERALNADAKEKARLYAEARSAEAAQKNDDAEFAILALESLLDDSLQADRSFDFETLKQEADIGEFDPGPLGEEESPPTLELPAFTPPPKPELPHQARLGKLRPGAKKEHERQLAGAEAEYQRQHDAARASHDEEVARIQAAHEVAVADHANRETARRQALEQAKAAHARDAEEQRVAAEKQHQEIEEFRKSVEAGDPSAIGSYFDFVLQASVYPDGFARNLETKFIDKDGMLVIDLELPGDRAIPHTAGFKYVKSRDEITESPLSPTRRKNLYLSVLSQVALRSIHEVFDADRSSKVAAVTFNGYIPATDPATGKPMKAFLLSVSADRLTFNEIDLAHVEPIACVKGLDGAITRSAFEKAPVKPKVVLSDVVAHDEA